MTLKVGNIVKCEDFMPVEGREACYKIGSVTEIQDNRFSFVVLLDIWDGKEYRNSQVDHAVMNTALPGRLMCDWPTRVQIIS